MDTLEMAKALLGGGQQKSGSQSGGQTTTAYGTAVGVSADGKVLVDFGGETSSYEDEQAVEVDTTFFVKEGDQVIVSLVGADGTGKAPVVTGVVGRGDETQTQINSVTNYFWHDAAGAHVSTQDHSVAGNNVLLDSDSLDIRFGNSNSEADQTVLASFGTEVTVGSRGMASHGAYSQVYGQTCVASGDYSFASGYYTRATGDYSHTEGWRTEASGNHSHAEGSQSKASGLHSHAEGSGAIASGDYSHAECIGKATGNYSHSEGGTASGIGSHSEGYATASGDVSHAEGESTVASGSFAHAEGVFTEAGSRMQHVQGVANVVDSSVTYLDIVGNGTVNNVSNPTSVTTRSNAYNLDWNGNAEFQGSLYEGGCTPNGETPYPVVRYNTGSSQMEYWNGAAWTAISGGGGGGVEFYTQSFNIPSASVAANSYKEWTFDISVSGYKPIAINRVNTNKSALVLCGFNMNSTNRTMYVFCRNVTSSSVTCDSGGVTILYVRE